ncbi:hypothetical protein SBOR_2375 [Sclerotinia borealis F-4128]|uniref:Transcription factor domain-containing protein n=1 Tax=Sclerotinia borealis (strain F-4128) TaxID=1432307 RepID=W9CKC4_SCLBF|nr:hypothetical protein SBOR_2375 [Sclerotinia borealis F-4128]
MKGQNCSEQQRVLKQMRKDAEKNIRCAEEKSKQERYKEQRREAKRQEQRRREEKIREEIREEMKRLEERQEERLTQEMYTEQEREEKRQEEQRRIEQKRELALADTCNRLTKIEALYHALSIKANNFTIDQASGSLIVDRKDGQPDEIRRESPPSSIGGILTPVSTIPSFDAYALVDENTLEDPITLPKRIRTREALLLDLITTELRDMIIIATCSWWHTWNPLGSWLPASMADKNTSTLPDFVHWAFESHDPSIIGIAILCIAVCLQQLDTRVHQYIIRQLPGLPGALFQEYFEKVNRLVIDDSDYASTEEGIDAIVFSAKIYLNLGLNRKCWVLTHQAIAYSKLLGHHRPNRLSENETEVQRLHRNQSWLSLCAGDVYLSLILGLPYAADGRTIPIIQSQHNTTSLFHHNIILLSAKVIRRNQRGLSLSMSCTSEIQKGLEVTTENLDESFWNAPVSLAKGKITREEYLEQITAQCWFYQLSVLLHMPLMIHAIKDARLETHRIACLAACRNLLKLYHTMRSDTFAAFSMVRLLDQQAFVCSALLILGLLGYGSPTPQHQGGISQDNDRVLIGITIATLRQTSSTVNNLIASQAVQGLETLMLLGNSDCPPKGRTHTFENGNPLANIVIPCVGIITISPGEYYCNSNSYSRVEKTVILNEAQVEPFLAFTLSHDVFHADSGSANQPSMMAIIITIDDREASGPGEGNHNRLQPELPPNGFDRGTRTTDVEEGWGWLSDVNF